MLVNDDQPSSADDDSRRIEQEIRSRRSADLASVLAGQDGGGHLKGASPTPVLQRAMIEIQQWLAASLYDGEGALRAVILRRLELEAERLESGLGDPAATVGAWLDRVLPRPTVVAELVRQADMEWGRLYGERPHFDRPGQAPHPDDPYTVAGVTASLTDLRRRCPD